MSDPNAPPVAFWTTSMTDSPNLHLWYEAEGEPTHESSAECACGPTGSPLTTGATLYLHQTVDPNPPPAPVAGGETAPDLAYAFAQINDTSVIALVVKVGYQATPTPPDPPDADHFWVDITGLDPAPQVGWLYDAGTFAPGARDVLEERAAKAVEVNDAFLELAAPTAEQTLAQVQALTDQATVLVLLRWLDLGDVEGVLGALKDQMS